jgi:hypothetical protein
MNLPIIAALVVLVIIIILAWRAWEAPPTPAPTAEQIAEEARVKAVLDQIAILETTLAASPTAILEKQIADLKASIGQ